MLFRGLREHFHGLVKPVRHPEPPGAFQIRQLGVISADGGHDLSVRESAPTLNEQRPLLKPRPPQTNLWFWKRELQRRRRVTARRAPPKANNPAPPGSGTAI